MKPILSLASLLMVSCLSLQALAESSQEQVTAAAFHTVRAGDCFDKIARAQGCSIAELATANGLPTDAILQLGQQLKLPTPPSAAHAESVAAANLETATPTLAAEHSHTIQPGDTFTKIAKQYEVSVNSLISANPTIKPTALRPGQKILLPLSDKSSTQETPKESPDTSIKAEAEKGDPQSSPIIDDKSFGDGIDTNPVLFQATARTIATDREMTYGELAALYGTETDRLNSLNGLDLQPGTLVVKGADLLVPVSMSR